MQNDIVLAVFSGFELDQAKKEGWSFEDRSGEIVLSRIKGQSKLHSVDDVYGHVINSAKRDSEFHIKVLDFIKVNNAGEFNYQNARYLQNKENKAEMIEGRAA